MKVFFDTEFTGLHQHTTLISIGLISEDNRTFYAEFNDYSQIQVNGWINDNVIKNLLMETPPPLQDEYFTWSKKEVQLRDTNINIASYLSDWFQELLGGPLSWVDYTNAGIAPVTPPKRITEPKIEIWSDCLAYDWVLFNQLFGHAFNIPECIYYIPFDICTLFKLKNIDPDINREEFAGMTEKAKKHNALWDAKVIKRCYENLIATEK